MLIELYPHFELILFTVGTQEYAHAFSKALHSFYWKSKFAQQGFFSQYAQNTNVVFNASGINIKSPARSIRNMEYGFGNQGGQGFFSHILSFKECLYSRHNEMHLKDLKILEAGRNLSDIIIVDNTIKSFYLQMDNGLPIYDFEADSTDPALLHLTVYLKTFLLEEDVRDKIAVDFGIRSAARRNISANSVLPHGLLLPGENPLNQSKISNNSNLQSQVGVAMQK
jgi:hypothetical protein